MKAERLVYMNGEFVTEENAKISIFDSALMFGDMVFEMTRSFNGEQFKLREHLERMYIGIKILHIPIDMTIDEMEEACLDTISKNMPAFEDHDEHRLMINVSRGPLGIYEAVFNGNLKPTVIIADFPLKWTVAAMAPMYETGINAVTPSQRSIPASLMEPKIKNRSRLFYQMANIEVSQTKGKRNRALLMDTDGFITEGTGDNFFIVKNNVIMTPEGRNVLRGISREYIFELAQELGLSCIEKNIEPYDVYNADEAFMTATPYCMLPVTSMNGIKISSGKIGKIYQKLMRQWSANVGLDIENQIQEYNKEVVCLNSDAPTPYQFKRKFV
jgi:branched-chain amino acid aminotransferase